jgi:hypothetical protein
MTATVRLLARGLWRGGNRGAGHAARLSAKLGREVRLTFSKPPFPCRFHHEGNTRLARTPGVHETNIQARLTMTRRWWLVLALMGTWVGGAGHAAGDEQGPMLFEAGSSSESSAPIADRHPLPRWRTPGTTEFRGSTPQPMTPVQPPASVADTDVWQDPAPPATAPQIIDRRRALNAPNPGGASVYDDERAGASQRRSSKPPLDAADGANQPAVRGKSPAKGPQTKTGGSQKTMKDRLSGRAIGPPADEPRELSTERGSRPNPYDRGAVAPDGASSRRAVQPLAPNALRGATPPQPSYSNGQPAGQPSPAYRGQSTAKPVAPQNRAQAKESATGGNVQRKPPATWPRTGQLSGSAR